MDAITEGLSDVYTAAGRGDVLLLLSMACVYILLCYMFVYKYIRVVC